MRAQWGTNKGPIEDKWTTSRGQVRMECRLKTLEVLFNEFSRAKRAKLFDSERNGKMISNWEYGLVGVMTPCTNLCVYCCYLSMFTDKCHQCLSPCIQRLICKVCVYVTDRYCYSLRSQFFPQNQRQLHRSDIRNNNAITNRWRSNVSKNRKCCWKKNTVRQQTSLNQGTVE